MVVLRVHGPARRGSCRKRPAAPVRRFAPMADTREPRRVSRRRMLGTLGAGAAGVLAGPALVRGEAVAAAAGRAPYGCAAAQASPTTFGRLFELPPFARPTPALQEAL